MQRQQLLGTQNFVDNKLLSDGIHVVLISGETRIYCASPTLKFFITKYMQVSPEIKTT